ncbi:MAG TPA: hypothetical protein VM074_13365, partial [Solimonas sp.]|nr:hypothetical protein [Solimonas sp.]
VAAPQAQRDTYFFFAFLAGFFAFLAAMMTSSFALKAARNANPMSAACHLRRIVALDKLKHNR